MKDLLDMIYERINSDNKIDSDIYQIIYINSISFHVRKIDNDKYEIYTSQRLNKSKYYHSISFDRYIIDNIKNIWSEYKYKMKDNIERLEYHGRSIKWKEYYFKRI